MVYSFDFDKRKAAQQEVEEKNARPRRSTRGKDNAIAVPDSGVNQFICALPFPTLMLTGAVLDCVS